MSVDAAWSHLREELARRETPLRLWLRDDDATMLTPALDKLLGLTAAFSVPVTLAVIPALTGKPLAQALSPHGTPVIHGWTHSNHAPPPEKKQELGPHRPLKLVEDDLTAAISRMMELYGDRFVRMLVPPWNRIRPDVLPRLPSLGFEALSAFGPAPSRPPLPVFNTHVDLIDWRGTRGCRDEAALIGELLAQAEEPEPIGILAHHLVHDAAAWAFLEKLFTLTRLFPNVRWLSARGLVDEGVSRHLGARPAAG